MMKKVLLCATEAGGMRNISPLLRPLKKNGYEPIIIFSRDSLSFCDTDGVRGIDAESISSPDKAAGLLVDLSVQALICGTTHYLSPERLLIAAAGKLKIKSLAVLDEWFNYRMRFQDDKGEFVYLPDAIAVMDELAKKEAVAEGLPQEKCHVTGSISLTALADKFRKFDTSMPMPPPFIEDGRPMFTFVSEVFAEDYGSVPGEKGPLGPYTGYTEHTVKEDIIAVLKRIDKPILLVEKLHPSAEPRGLGVIADGNLKVVTVKDSDLHALFWHSNAIIGMRSMVLLEAAMLNKPAVSYQPGLCGKNLCTAVRLDLISCISELSELEKWFRRRLEVKEKGSISCRRLPFVDNNVAAKTLRLVLKDYGVRR